MGTSFRELLLLIEPFVNLIRFPSSDSSSSLERSLYSKKNGEKNGDGYILPVVGDQRHEPTMSIKKSGKYARAYVESSRHCYTGLSGSSKSQTGRNQETEVFFFCPFTRERRRKLNADVAFLKGRVLCQTLHQANAIVFLF